MAEEEVFLPSPFSLLPSPFSLLPSPLSLVPCPLSALAPLPSAGIQQRDAGMQRRRANEGRLPLGVLFQPVVRSQKGDPAALVRPVRRPVSCVGSALDEDVADDGPVHPLQRPQNRPVFSIGGKEIEGRDGSL